MTVIDILFAGLQALQEYLSAHVLTCLIPAFFIAGAIAVFVSKQSILKYFGAKTKKYISYPIASVSGSILAVCSCTILPLFTSIYKRGAGIGPASTFLYSGPAINILAIVLTARVLGFEIGVARVIGAVIMAILIGVCMSIIFSSHDKKNTDSMYLYQGDESNARPLIISVLFFSLLVSILVVGAASTDYISIMWKISIVALLILATLVVLHFHYTIHEAKEWVLNTWDLFKKIFPVLLAGVFIVGIIGGVAAFFMPNADPSNAVGVAVAPYIGSNNIFSCFLASIIGGVLYMPTLLEVPIVGNLFGYSSGLMAGGTALALLLAGPSLSLPNIIVIIRVVGIRKAAAYIGLVVVSATITGYMYGIIGGT